MMLHFFLIQLKVATSVQSVENKSKQAQAHTEQIKEEWKAGISSGANIGLKENSSQRQHEIDQNGRTTMKRVNT